MINVGKLRNITTEIVKRYGENDANTSLVADCLVKPDMRGIFTHGVGTLCIAIDINHFMSIKDFQS